MKYSLSFFISKYGMSHFHNSHLFTVATLFVKNEHMQFKRS